MRRLDVLEEWIPVTATTLLRRWRERLVAERPEAKAWGTSPGNRQQCALSRLALFAAPTCP